VMQVWPLSASAKERCSVGGGAATTHEHPIQEQQNQCPNDGDDDRTDVHARHSATTEKTEQEPAHNGAGDPDQNGDDDPAWVSARHDQLCQHPCDQPQNDPRDYAHYRQPPVEVVSFLYRVRTKSVNYAIM